MRKELEKFSLKFSSCNPFPSAAKDTCYQFQCTDIEIANKKWLFKENLKFLDRAPLTIDFTVIKASLFVPLYHIHEVFQKPTSIAVSAGAVGSCS